MSFHAKPPEMLCMPVVMCTPGLSSWATTAAGTPSTLTSCGQCFRSPGNGIHSERNAATCSEKLAPLSVTVSVRRDGQLHWRCSPLL